jgi:hypothetical protein
MTVVHNGSTVSVAGDSRITPFGAKLRHYKIDELPGLWDVLIGNMSFVGPRPDVPGYADKLTGDDRDVLKLRPGITGPATLKYRVEDEMIAEFVAEIKAGKNTQITKFENTPDFSKMSDQELLVLNGTDFKDPTVSIILSVLVGGLGVDRFYIGDVGLGVAKLLTGGGLGVWWLVDLFIIQKKTKKNNSEDLNETMMLNKAILAE